MTVCSAVRPFLSALFQSPVALAVENRRSKAASAFRSHYHAAMVHLPVFPRSGVCMAWRHGGDTGTGPPVTASLQKARNGAARQPWETARLRFLPPVWKPRPGKGAQRRPSGSRSATGLLGLLEGTCCGRAPQVVALAWSTWVLGAGDWGRRHSRTLAGHPVFSRLPSAPVQEHQPSAGSNVRGPGR